jgi:hypothetical protein
MNSSDYAGVFLMGADGITAYSYMRGPYQSTTIVNQPLSPVIKLNTVTGEVDNTEFLDTTIWSYSSSTYVSTVFSGGVIVPDGRHLLAPMGGINNWVLYDYNTQTQTLITDTVSSSSRQYGSVVWSSVTGTAFAFPYNREQITEVDISAGTATKTGVGDTGTGYGWGAACEGPNGKIYLFPAVTNRISEFDPTTKTLRDLPSPLQNARMWHYQNPACPQAVYVDTHNVMYGAPFTMLDIPKLDFNILDANGSPTVSVVPHGYTDIPSAGYTQRGYCGGIVRTEEGTVICTPCGASKYGWISPMIYLDPTDDSVTSDSNPFPSNVVDYIPQYLTSHTNINGTVTSGLMRSFSNLGANGYYTPLIQTFSTPTTWDPTDPLFNHAY